MENILESKSTEKVMKELINLIYEDSIYDWESVLSDEFRAYICEETGLQEEIFNLVMAD